MEWINQELRYLGSRQVPGGSAVQYYSYAGEQLSASLERCLPCFGPWHFDPSSQVLVVTLPDSLPPSGETVLLQRLGMDLSRPVYRLEQGGRPAGKPLRFCLQEIPVPQSLRPRGAA